MPGNAGSFLSSLLDIVTANAAPDAQSTVTVPSTPLATPTSGARKGGKEKETASKPDTNAPAAQTTTSTVPVTIPTTDTTPLLLRLLQFGLTIEPRPDKPAPLERSGSNSPAPPAAQNIEEDGAEPQSAAAPATQLAFALRLTDSQATAPAATTPASPANAQPAPASNDSRAPQQAQQQSTPQAQTNAPVQAVRAALPAQSNDNQPATSDTNHNPKQQHEEPSSTVPKSEPAAVAPVTAAATQASAPVISAAAPAHPTAPPPAPETSPAAHAAEVNEPVEKPMAPAAAQRISLTVSDSQNQQVEVHLMERAGEVRVSVRAADETMSHSMRADLGSLSGKLAQSGYNAESYTPAASNTASFSNERQASDGRESSTGGRQNSQQNQPGGQQQSSREGRGQRPAWAEELENSLASSAAIRSNAPWRQA